MVFCAAWSGSPVLVENGRGWSERQEILITDLIRCSGWRITFTRVTLLAISPTGVSRQHHRKTTQSDPTHPRGFVSGPFVESSRVPGLFPGDNLLGRWEIGASPVEEWHAMI